MRHIRQCLLVLGMVSLAAANLFATYGSGCNTINGLSLCWHDSPPSNSTNNTGLAPWCAPNVQSTCGYFYFDTAVTGWLALNGRYGWHGFANSTLTAQQYLNTFTSTTGVAIQLSSASSLYIGASPAHYLNPTSDNGYFLSTANLTTTPGIRISFNNPIKDFAMYWGSVDPWNTITFTDTNNVPHTYNGAQLPNWPGFDSQGNNSHSILAWFSLPTSASAPWTQVSFSSCDSAGVCKPAFEFDNLEWRTLTGGPAPGLASPTPESSSLLLLGTGVVGVAEWLRRSVRS